MYVVSARLYPERYKNIIEQKAGQRLVECRRRGAVFRLASLKVLMVNQMVEIILGQVFVPWVRRHYQTKRPNTDLSQIQSSKYRLHR